MTNVVLATAGYDKTIRFWEATSGICSKTLQYADSHINKLEITSDKRVIAAAGLSQIKNFDVVSGNLISQYEGHVGNVTAIGFQKEGRWMYSGGEDGTVKLWDLRSRSYSRSYESRAAVNTVVLHPNQGELISGDQNGNIRVWDLQANACTCELVPEVGTAIRSLSIAVDGSLVVAANNNGICFVWRTMKGSSQNTNFEPLHKLKAHSTYILKCLLSPDGHKLATASADKTVKLWNLDGFQLDIKLEGHTKWVWDCVFSVDAAYLVTASSDCKAKLWDVSARAAIKTYAGHSKAAVCCALNDSALSEQS
eukprot:TRINITY_DN5750_c0_g1_i14.p1 TRINITY_DN5750_c0_g1~~TRINITY_DN5750_c0_g1_i14.p1  ORF type:complete len:309 (+),score=31.33 TRINITY_DN5750_c0_g1_i14:39-965(+)